MRFASVYRSFRNLNQFMDELRTLLDRQDPETGLRAKSAADGAEGGA